MKYYVIKCPKCHQFSVQQTTKPIEEVTFKCKRNECLKTITLKKKGHLALQAIIYGPYDSQMARHVATTIAKEIKQDNEDTSFHNYTMDEKRWRNP
jgi:hypothetical protein